MIFISETGCKEIEIIYFEIIFHNMQPFFLLGCLKNVLTI